MAGTQRELLKDLVRQAGLRATAPRIAVLQLLQNSRRPLSHTEVVAELGQDEFDQATLYRNLTKLEENGLARVVSRMNGIARYEFVGDDQKSHAHPHFSCNGCGNTKCLPQVKLPADFDPQWREIFQGDDLQVVGLCPLCR